jgi:hypothetical protein
MVKAARIRIRLLAALPAVVWSPWRSRPARAATTGEYEVKAAFLYNFAKFVEWPQEVFAGSDGHLVVGVLGDDPFGEALDRIAQQKTVQGRRIVIRRWRNLKDVMGAHVLFVSPAEERNLAAILRVTKDSHVLTVSDLEGFAERGGAISLFLEERRVRFAVNLKATEQAGLKMSAQLLKIAKIVHN